jgi:signal transduction histidine kinase
LLWAIWNASRCASSLALGDLERKSLHKLQQQIHTMISGLGSLQRNYAIRNQIMENRIEASQRTIARTASTLDKRYAEIEENLRGRYSRRLSFINAFAILLSLLIIGITFLFSSLVFNSIRIPLGNLLRTVEAFSQGNFNHPVPEVGQNELALLAGGLRDFRLSAMQRTLAENALRDSEGRFRALSDMSSDFFWEQNEMLQYTAFSGQRAGDLLSRNVLMLGLRSWENPRNTGYEEAWEQHRQAVESHQPFRDFEFALQMPDGKLLYLLSSGDPVISMTGSFSGYRGTAKDISAQKAIEAEIRQLNQTLEQRVIERTAALRQSNDQLSQAMEQLVQSEKLASLGNLVAGVAHELNTPLGNALVASTSLRDQVHEMEQAISAGTLRKSALTEFMSVCEEGCRLIERNAYRAVSLVANFKQVAVDQTSAQRREFNLLQTVQEVVATLSPTLRKQQHSLTIDIPESIVLNSYPGPLDQVITNIVTNATVHAFQPGQAGALLISASSIGENEVVMLISDNGAGIPLDKQARVFDPFFTTRLGQGGSGLGLYIVYNIVTSLLGGHIQLVSTPGAGTCFLIHLPREAPHLDDSTSNVHGSPQAHVRGAT